MPPSRRAAAAGMATFIRSAGEAALTSSTGVDGADVPRRTGATWEILLTRSWVELALDAAARASASEANGPGTFQPGARSGGWIEAIFWTALVPELSETLDRSPIPVERPGKKSFPTLEGPDSSCTQPLGHCRQVHVRPSSSVSATRRYWAPKIWGTCSRAAFREPPLSGI